MKNIDKLVSLYVDMPSWEIPIMVDDFLVSIGEKKSNSVYHVLEVKTTYPREHVMRCYVKVFRSDLVTALQRSSYQKLITLKWNKR